MATAADEVAEDYKAALEDLSSNTRFEISNLTVIARENSEFAHSIAQVLEQHIEKAPPQKKLPALYVMDSIVKNVGTPYTQLFGPKLDGLFWKAYLASDQHTRRKMEEMLRTWNERIPGSLDNRHVFPDEVMKPMMEKLKSVYEKQLSGPRPMMGRPMPGQPHAQMSRHNTATPPGMRGQRMPPGYPTQPPYPGQQAPYPPHSTPQPMGSNAAPFQAPFPGTYGSAGAPGPARINIDTLKNDIQNLIVATQVEASHNPHNPSVRNKLKALQDLQGVLQSNRVQPDQLELIKNQVADLAVVNMRAPSSQTPTPAPVSAFSQAPPVPPMAVAPTPAPVAPQPGTVTLASLLGPGAGALAALMAKQAANSQNSTPNPTPPFANVAIRSPPPTHAEPPKPIPAPVAPVIPAAPAAASSFPMGLLDQLRAAGMITPTAATPTAATPTPPPAPMAPVVSAPPTIPAALAALAAPAAPAVPAASTAPAATSVASIVSSLPPHLIASLLASQNRAAAPINPGINSASLKQPCHPSLLSGLYDDLGPPCTQCGRRFKTDEEGRKKKTAHMDWHFRVHQRTNEAEKRGMHRSWYVDQRDWLNSREVVDADHIPTTKEDSTQASKATEAAKPQYIIAPVVRKGEEPVCPICSDPFEKKWLDEAQDFVWLDTVRVGDRAFHASCRVDIARDRESTPGFARGAPEPVLGKRKAETSISSPKIRSLKTSA